MTRFLLLSFERKPLVLGIAALVGSTAVSAAQPLVAVASAPAATASVPATTVQGAPAASLADVLQTIGARSPDVLAAQAGQTQARAQG
jgi:hypothetical protein